MSEGGIKPARIEANWSTRPFAIDDYIYLRYQNVVGGILVDPAGPRVSYNMTDFQDLFNKMYEICSEGSSKIYLKSNLPS